MREIARLTLWFYSGYKKWYRASREETGCIEDMVTRIPTCVVWQTRENTGSSEGSGVVDADLGAMPSGGTEAMVPGHTLWRWFTFRQWEEEESFSKWPTTAEGRGRERVSGRWNQALTNPSPDIKKHMFLEVLKTNKQPPPPYIHNMVH